MHQVYGLVAQRASPAGAQEPPRLILRPLRGSGVCREFDPALRTCERIGYAR